MEEYTNTTQDSSLSKEEVIAHNVKADAKGLFTNIKLF